MWARWLELQRDRVRAVTELVLEKEEAADCKRRTKRRRQQRRKEIWVRQWLTRRPLYGQYEQLMRERNREDADGYRNLLRVDADKFGELLDRISPRCSNTCSSRTALSASSRHPGFANTLQSLDDSTDCQICKPFYRGSCRGQVQSCMVE